MIRSDAWDEKPEVHASTPEVQLMHEAEKQGGQHHFLPLSRPAPLPVGVAPPAKPYPTVGPRQQFVRKVVRSLPMLAPPRRQTLISPPGHANILLGRPPGACPCWRRLAGKTLSHHRATPTLCPEGRPAPVHVGVALPAKPYPTVGPRQQAVHFYRRAQLLKESDMK